MFFLFFLLIKVSHVNEIDVIVSELVSRVLKVEMRRLFMSLSLVVVFTHHVSSSVCAPLKRG